MTSSKLNINSPYIKFNKHKKVLPPPKRPSVVQHAINAKRKLAKFKFEEPTLDNETCVAKLRVIKDEIGRAYDEALALTAPEIERKHKEKIERIKKEDAEWEQLKKDGIIGPNAAYRGLTEEELEELLKKKGKI